MSNGNLARKVRSRRSPSSARRRAAVVSQAPGLRGTPCLDHASSAATYASCTHSSATSRSRVTRAVAASTNAHSRRCACATAARIAVRSHAADSAGSVMSSQSHHVRGVHDRANLNAAEPRRAQFGDFDRVVEIAGLDQVETAECFLGLDERPVGYDVGPDRGRGRGRLESLATGDLGAVLAHLSGKPAVLLADLLPDLRAAVRVAAL